LIYRLVLYHADYLIAHCFLARPAKMDAHLICRAANPFGQAQRLFILFGNGGCISFAF
jgi:hypothetical protein